MNRKIRFGLRNPGTFLPNIGIVTPTVPEKVGDILIEAVVTAKVALRAAGHKDWADRLVCEWR